MRLALFDCDGTLVDSQHLIVAAMEEAFLREDLPWPGRAPTLSVVGLSLAEALAHLLPEAPPPARARLAEAYRTTFHALRQDPAHHEPLFAGAREALDGLLAREDVALGIATGKSRRGVAALLERQGLDRHFSTVQTADDAPSKPHPAMVELAMAATGATPAETVVIGDTSFDMLMARAAGAGALGVGWGYHPASRLRETGAQAIAGHFGEVAAHLNRLWRDAA